MKKLSRREFLKLLALTSGGVALEQILTACGLRPNPIYPPTASPPSPPGATNTPFGPVTEAAPPPT